MNLDERRLSRLLHELTPQPPRPLSIDDIAEAVTQQAEPRRRLPAARRWLPIFGAVAAVAVIAVVTALLVPQSHTTTPTTPPAAPSISINHSPIRPTPRAVGPWGVTLINSGQFSELVSDGTHLYALTDANGALVRIDPVTGAVAARRTTSGLPVPLVVAGESLWVPSGTSSAGTVRLDRLDPSTLAPTGMLPVSFAGTAAGQTPALAATADGRRLYLGAGNSVAVIDVETHRVIDRIPVSGGNVTAVALTPDGGRIYVGVTSASGSQVEALDAATGSQISSSGPLDGDLIGTWGFVATAGGIWSSVATGGHTEQVEFAPADDLAHPRVIAHGGGGLDAYVTVSNGAAWIGGYSIACADPDTAHVRATASMGGHGYLAGVAHTAGHAYAIFADLTGKTPGGLVRLDPPANC